VTDSRINVYHNLSVMLNAGLPISRALKTVEKQGRFGRVIGRLEQEVARGQSLSDAVDIYQRKFEKLDISLIKVGEHTAKLPKSLNFWRNGTDFGHVLNGRQRMD